MTVWDDLLMLQPRYHNTRMYMLCFCKRSYLCMREYLVIAKCFISGCIKKEGFGELIGFGFLRCSACFILFTRNDGTLAFIV